MWEYIEGARDLVHDLEMRVQKSKDNVDKLKKIMATWSKTSLFERKEGKNESLLNLDDRVDRREKRYTEIEAAGQQLHQLLEVRSSSFLSASVLFHTEVTTHICGNWSTSKVLLGWDVA